MACDKTTAAGWAGFHLGLGLGLGHGSGPPVWGVRHSRSPIPAWLARSPGQGKDRPVLGPCQAALAVNLGGPSPSCVHRGGVSQP